MQADGRLVQHIEHTGGTVAHRTGQLHPLALTGGKSGRGAVQRQVAKAQREQPCRCRLEGFADIAGHGPHLFRQTVRHTRHPIGKLHKSHLTSLVQRDAPQLWGTSRITQPGAAAVRADALPQELFHPLHALFILDLGEGVLHGIGGIEIGKIQLPGLIGIFVMIKNALFLRRAMENDILFPVGQVAEGHIGAHAHLPADIHHQRPHQALPRGHGTFVDRKRIVRHKGALVHGHHHAGTAAGAAGTLTVEGKFFSGKRAHAGTALRAEQRLFCRHGKAGFQPVAALRAGIAGKTGEHQAQTVQQFRAGTKGAADARHSGPLMQCQCSRNIQHFVHRCLCRLRHAAARIGGKCVQIPAGAFGVKHAQRKAGLARTGHARHTHDFAQRHIHIHVFQVVHPRAADPDMVDHLLFPPAVTASFLNSIQCQWHLPAPSRRAR